MKNIKESIICAGFGGQGIMLLGKVLANAGMLQKLHVTWLPAYGAEVRGGTAYSAIRISSKPIASPTIECADTAIILNGPSLEKFENKIAPGGLLILNTSLVDRECKRKDIDIVEVPLTDEAIKLGNVRVANMIAAGIFTIKKKIFSKSILKEVINKMAAGYEDRIAINLQALELGIEIVS